MPSQSLSLTPAIALAVLACTATCAVPAACGDESRVWADRTGKYSVTARLAELRDDAVVLKTADGRTIAVPIERLSRGDLKHVERLREDLAAAAATDKGPRYGEPKTVHVRLGLEVTAQGGPCKNIYCTFPMPMDWPEQTVTEVSRDISKSIVGARSRVLADGVKQFEFRVPRLPAGATARAVLNFKIERRPILPPKDPDLFVVPRTISARLRPFISESPMIEVRHATVKAAAEGIELDESQTAWRQVETIYDWTRARVHSDGTKPLKGALAALVSGTGDCEERTSLFVAMCRLKKIPARSVWIEGHAYPEFYLEDDTGRGHWFPCESLGARSFGGVDHISPLLQKGDSFRMSQRKEPQRYVTPTASCMLSNGSGQPVIREVRERMDAAEAGGS